MHIPIIDGCDPLWYENTSTPLHQACWRGLINEVQWLIDKFGYSEFHRGLHGWTPLHSASYGGHTEILQLLIDKYGCDPNEGDDNNVSSLHMASYKGHLSIVQCLIDTYRISPDLPDNNDNTALLYSALGGHFDLIKFFLSEKCNSLQLNCDGASLSLLACKSGQVAVVQKLEEHHVFVPNSRSYAGLGILHYACQSIGNGIELFQHLLKQYQVPIDVKDRCGMTPLHYASWYASSTIAEYIISSQGSKAILATDSKGFSSLHHLSDAYLSETGIVKSIVYNKIVALADGALIEAVNNACIMQNMNFIKRQERVSLFISLLMKASTCPSFDINATTDKGFSLLHLSSRSGSTLLVKALEKYVIKVGSSVDDFDRSPVHWASYSGSSDVLKYVVAQYSLKANNPDHTGCTPLFYSCQSGNTDSVEYLINAHSSDPDVADNKGMTCLHHSCLNGHIDVTRYLIEVQGCDVNKKDSEGRTLVHHAASSGNLELFQYLITEKDLSPTVRDDNDLTALHYALLTFNLPFVTHRSNKLPAYDASSASSTSSRFLTQLINEYQLDISSTAANTLLYKAIEGGHVRAVLYLTSLPQCNVAATALHDTCESSGSLPILKHLVENHQLDLGALKGDGKGDGKGAKNGDENHGMAPFHYACLKGKLNLVYYITEYLKSRKQNRLINHFLKPRGSDKKQPLHYACQSGNIQLVSFLINKMKCVVTAKTARGSTCIMFACSSGNLDLVQLLIQQYKLKPFAADKIGSTALHVSVENGHVHILDWYHQTYGVDIPNHRNNKKRALTHSAALKGRLHALKQLLNKYCCDVNAFTDTGDTVLHKAIEGGHVPVVLYLTSLSQCNVAAKSFNGSTALHFTCKTSCSLPILKHLVENHQTELDLCAARNDGMAPIHLACSKGSLNLVQYIIERSPLSLELRDSSHRLTPFLIAVQYKQLEVSKYLISKKCNLSASNNKGLRSAHISAWKGHIDILKHLVENDYCDLNATDHQNRTPLQIAVACDQLEAVQYLTCNTKAKLNVQFDAQNDDGNTMLHDVCQHQQQRLGIVSLLVKVCRISVTNRKGQTPLHLAAAAGHKKIAEALVSSISNVFTRDELLATRDNEGCTAFYAACSNGRLSVFHYLCSVYPEGVYSIDNKGRSLLHAACIGGNQEMVEILAKKYELDPELKDQDGITCLHLIAQKEGTVFLEYFDIKMYEYLIQHVRTDPAPKDNFGRSPLHYACSAGNIRMAHYLSEKFCTPTAPDCSGCTSVHAACKAGSIELVHYFLEELKVEIKENELNDYLSFAKKSSNKELDKLVRLLVGKFRQQHIEVPETVDPDLSVYLQKAHYHGMMMGEKEREVY